MLRSIKSLIILLVGAQLGFSQPVASAPAGAKLVGVSDRAVEQDGKITSLEIMARTVVYDPGTYSLTFELRAANGKSLPGYVQAQVATGEQTFAARFDVQMIGDYLEQDGPYRIVNASIFRVSENGGRTLVDRAPETVTRPYRLMGMWRSYFTGEIEATGVDLTSSGKFGALRVSAGVVTAGGGCWLSGTLTDSTGGKIESGGYSMHYPNGIPSGKVVMAVDFSGSLIARHWKSGSLIVSDLTVSCNVPDETWPVEVVDRRRHLIAGFPISDFDNPPTDFKFIVKEKLGPTAAGEKIHISIIRIQATGVLDGAINLSATAPDTRIQIDIPAEQLVCYSSTLRCLRDGGDLIVLDIVTAVDLPPGVYPIRVTGKAAGKEHTVEFPIVIDHVLTERKRQRDQTLADLTREDPISQPRPILPLEGAPGEVYPPFKFSAEVVLRKIRAMLVLDRSSSMQESGNCAVMKAAAIRFSRLFADGRDSLGVISYGSTVQVALPLTDHFRNASERISQINCFGSTNTGDAIAMARKMLTEHPDPEAIHAIILFTDGKPYGVTADWTPSKPCFELKDGKVAATQISMGDMGSVMIPVTASVRDEGYFMRRRQDSCFGLHPKVTYAYLPESDIHGIAFTGSRPLKRFEDGPYVGKIQLNSYDNIVNASANEARNLMRLVRSDTQNPTFVYVIGFANGNGIGGLTSIDELQQLANDSKSAIFDSAQTAGVAILADKPEEIWPAFQKVRQHIVEWATVGKSSVP